MTSALSYIHRLLLALWLGGMLFFSGVVAPVVFSGILPTTQLSGDIVSAVLSRLDFFGMIAGPGLILTALVVAGFSALRDKIRVGLVVAMTALAATSHFVIQPSVHALRIALRTSEASRPEFNTLHKLSTTMMAVEILCGLVVLAILPARRKNFDQR
jgi:uncharacterized membrane protein